MKRMGKLMSEGGYRGVDLVEVPPGLGVDNVVCKTPVLGMLKLVKSNSRQEGLALRDFHLTTFPTSWEKGL